MNQNKFSGRLRSSVLILLAAIVLTALAAAADVRLPGAVEAGSRVSFNAGWRFARFGEQADGSKVAEPEELEMPAFDDKEWRQLDLPHDWGIEGPFKIELPGETGKLPWFELAIGTPTAIASSSEIPKVSHPDAKTKILAFAIF